LEGWIKVAHRLFIEVDDATRFERPDIVYLNDGSLIGDFNKGVCGPVASAMADACPYRKLNPQVLMVQPTKHRPRFDTPGAVNEPSNGRILA
jgi:hypothetical protein